MEYVLVMASLVTAFIAGVAALFAPCCITVLLPAYLGSIFRQKATIMLMTFVFFAGLLAVFLPLGLGFAALGVLFSKYHNLIFVSGGVFLLLLGASTLLGMHFPLFILAYFVDKSDLGNRLSFFKKQVSYFIAKKKIEVTIAEMIAGIMFLLMGTLILYLAKMGKLAMSSDYQVSVNIFMANLTTLINSFFVKGPLVVWFLFAAAVLLALIALIKRGKGQVD